MTEKQILRFNHLQQAWDDLKRRDHFSLDQIREAQQALNKCYGCRYWARFAEGKHCAVYDTMTSEGILKCQDFDDKFNL